MKRLMVFCTMFLLMCISVWYMITLQKPHFILDNFNGGFQTLLVGAFYVTLLGSLFISVRWFVVRSKGWENSYDPSLNGLNNAMRFRNSKFNAMSNERALELMRDTQVLDAASNGSNLQETENVYRYMGSRLNGMSNEDGLDFLRGK